jgi:hypothetical protein
MSGVEDRIAKLSKIGIEVKFHSIIKKKGSVGFKNGRYYFLRFFVSDHASSFDFSIYARYNNGHFVICECMDTKGHTDIERYTDYRLQFVREGSFLEFAHFHFNEDHDAIRYSLVTFYTEFDLTCSWILKDNICSWELSNWGIVRIIWIAKLKEHPSSCPISMLPIDMIRVITSLIRI